MKRLLFLALLLCPLSVLAQDSLLRVAAPTDFKVTGPATSDVNKPVSLIISGLPAVDLAKPLGEQTLWVETIRFELSSPATDLVLLDKELSMSVSPWEWRLRVNFTPKTPGTYLLVCDWNQEPFGLALHRVEVGGAHPPTPPTPTNNPYPEPPTNLKLTIPVKMERQDATKLAELYFQAGKLVASAPAAIAAGTKPEVGTTAELRAWLVDNGKPLNLAGKYAGLAAAVEAFLIENIKLTTRPVIIPDDVKVLEALAWSIWEAGQ